MIEEQVAKFLAEKQRRVKSAWTVAFYRNSVERLFLPWALAHGVTDGRTVTVAQWDAYVDDLRGRDLAEQSVNTYLRGPRIFLKWLDVPLKDFWMPKPDKPLLEVLTREEIDLLEATATNERDKLIVRVLANTGLRLSELLGLKLPNLRVVAGNPLRPSKLRYRLRVLGKGRKEREVGVDEPTFRRLEAFAHAGEQRTYIFPALLHRPETGTLAIMDGPRLSNNAVDKMFRELKKLTGITKPCTPHKLRHAFATWALQTGWRPMQLKKQLGHSSLNMIDNVYSHISPDDVSDEYERVFGTMEDMESEPKKRRRIA